MRRHIVLGGYGSLVSSHRYDLYEIAVYKYPNVCLYVCMHMLRYRGIPLQTARFLTCFVFSPSIRSAIFKDSCRIEGLTSLSLIVQSHRNVKS